MQTSGAIQHFGRIQNRNQINKKWPDIWPTITRYQVHHC